MSRSLSSPTAAALALPITAPGYLVEIQFATAIHLSSRATVEWSGSTFAPWDIRLEGIGVDGTSPSQTGRLTLGDPAFAISALVLDEGIAGRRVNIWKFYENATDEADPVLIFAGVGDDAQITPSGGRVTIGLRQASAAAFAPRQYMTRETGWNFLPAPGSVVSWGNTTLRLEGEQ